MQSKCPPCCAILPAPLARYAELTTSCLHASPFPRGSLQTPPCLPESSVTPATAQFSRMRVWLWPMVTFPSSFSLSTRLSSAGEGAVIGGPWRRGGGDLGLGTEWGCHLCWKGKCK